MTKKIRKDCRYPALAYKKGYIHIKGPKNQEKALDKAINICDRHNVRFIETVDTMYYIIDQIIGNPRDVEYMGDEFLK